MPLTDKLQAIADAIRGQTGKSDKMTLDQMPEEIKEIEGSTVIKYTTGTLIPVTIDNWDEEGEGHTKTVKVTGYNPGPNGLQVGMPDKESVTNELALLQAALTIQNVTHVAPKDVTGTTNITFSAIKIPEDKLVVGIFGLEECEQITIPYANILLDQPVTGASAPSKCDFEENAATCKVSWEPNDTTFKKSTVYTATITVVPNPGYKIDGVAANFFKCKGATCTNDANSDTVTAKFAATK